MHFPSLPLRFYDSKFLTVVGNRIGKTIRIDETILDQAKGKYFRVCVEVDLSKPILFEFSVKGKIYVIEYESIHILLPLWKIWPFYG